MICQLWHSTVKKSHLSRRTLRPVDRRTLLGLTEVLVIRMTAPQLLTRVIRTELEEERESAEDEVTFHQNAIMYT